jgi:hypothetical protein
MRERDHLRLLGGADLLAELHATSRGRCVAVCEEDGHIDLLVSAVCVI